MMMMIYEYVLLQSLPWFGNHLQLKVFGLYGTYFITVATVSDFFFTFVHGCCLRFKWTHCTLQQFMELFSIKEMRLEDLDCIIPA
jgi:hypothetical protein